MSEEAVFTTAFSVVKGGLGETPNCSVCQAEVELGCRDLILICGSLAFRGAS